MLTEAEIEAEIAADELAWEAEHERLRIEAEISAFNAKLDAELLAHFQKRATDERATVDDLDEQVEEAAPLEPDPIFLIRKAQFEVQYGTLDESKSNLWREWQRKQGDKEREQFRESLQWKPTLMSIPVPSNYQPATVPDIPKDLIQSSGDFVRGFVPPDYLLDGILQRRFCYSLTAATGTGKTAIAMLIAAHVDTGRPLGNLEVTRGAVIYFAAENPTDIQMRWLGLTREMKVDPAKANVHFVSGRRPLTEIGNAVREEVARKGIRPALVVIDTSAAMFPGDEENSNTQVIAHAVQMRSLTELPGGPCVFICCHPTKHANDDNLVPRGGGGFLNEMDGNIAARKHESLVVATAQGKFRGPEFPPLSFELSAVTHPLLKDTRGRMIPTVVARPVDELGRNNLEAASERDEDTVLKVIDKCPNAKASDLARQIGWKLRDGKPNHVKVQRAAQKLAKDKLVEEVRGKWRLTTKGQRELNAAETSPILPPVTSQQIIASPPFPPQGPE